MGELEVVVVGLNVVDATVVLPPQVRAGQKHRVDRLSLQGGGPAGNAACLLAALGWRTGMLARLGANALSAVARADFAAHGVRDDLFIDDAAAQPAFAVVEVAPASGERTVYYSLGGYRTLLPEDVPAAAIYGARLLFTDGYETAAALAALRIARQRGVPSVVDLEDGDPETLLAIAELATDVIMPLSAGQRLSNEREPADVLSWLAARTAARIIVTDGAEGSWAATPHGVHHQAAIPVEVVDTTGCGDAYHAGYASALLDGYSLEACMELAARVASHAATHLGGRDPSPDRATKYRSYRAPPAKKTAAN